MNGKNESKDPKPREGYPDIMTVEQVADYLQLHKQVIYRHVKKGTIPASRIGSTLRFKKSVIDSWLTDSALEGLRSTREEAGGAPPSPFNVEED